ncbi:MAG: TolC family protein, partial [Rhodospirillaceae bacterium]
LTVLQAQSRLAGAVADTVESAGTLEISRANFEQVVGMRPGVLVEPIPFSDLPLSLDDAISLATSNNPDVVAALYNWEAAQADIKDQRGALLPSFNASFTYTYQDEAAVDNFITNTALVTGTLTIPIYQQGAVYSQIRDAKHRAGQSRLDADQTRNEVRESATQGWENLSSAKARVDSFNAQIEAASIALEGVSREAQVGSRTVLDVLDAEQELLTARVNLVRAKRDVAVSTYELLTALGRMTAQDLALGTPIYDPTEHYREVKWQWFGSSESADQDAAYGRPTN